jgi:hypothetical protein
VVKLGKVRYQAQVNGVDVTERVTELVWEHTTREVAERGILELALHPTRDDRVYAAVGTGATMVFFADGVNVFEGRIEVAQFTEKRPVTLQLTGYGTAFLLGANEIDVSFPQSYTTGDVVRLLANLGMPIGRNDWGNVDLGPAQPYRKKTLGFVVEDTNRKLRTLGHGDFVVRSIGNGIELIKTDPSAARYRFTPANTTLMQDQMSTQELVTVVKFVSSQIKYGGEATVAAPKEFPNPDASPALYGVRTRIVTDQVAQGEEAAAAAAIFEQVGQPQRVQLFEAPDVPLLRKGDAVDFAVGTASGTLVLTGVHHDARKGVVRLEVDTTGKNRHRVATTKEKPYYTGPSQPLVPPATPARVPEVDTTGREIPQ